MQLEDTLQIMLSEGILLNVPWVVVQSKGVCRFYPCSTAGQLKSRF